MEFSATNLVHSGRKARRLNSDVSSIFSSMHERSKEDMKLLAALVILALTSSCSLSCGPT